MKYNCYVFKHAKLLTLNSVDLLGNKININCC